MAREPAQNYQIKITLNDSRPPIWRRILVPSNITLRKLHDILQIVMGWTDSHLHQFTIEGKGYGDAQNDEWDDLRLLPEQRYRLSQVAPRSGARFQYEYDFGDSWEHSLRVEKILPPEPGTRYPQCLAGKRACPPEDVGGVWGYQEFLEALADPDDPQHDEYLEWIGGAFDAEAFDPGDVNTRLRHAQRGRGRSAETANAWAMEEDEPDEPPIALTAAWLPALSADERAVAEHLPLRRDMLALLTYLRDNPVVGTQSTGNLPLKAVREICARFVVPLPLEDQIGDHVFRVRSEAEVRPLFFLHALATAAGWVAGGPARRWRITVLGEQLLGAAVPQQVWLMFATWWTQLDWALTLGFVPQGFLSEALTRQTLRQLQSLSGGSLISFEPFADQLIAEAGLVWRIQDQESARHILHGIVERAVLDPLRDFGALEAQYAPSQILGPRYQDLTAFRVTLFGHGLLEAIGKAAGRKQP